MARAVIIFDSRNIDEGFLVIIMAQVATMNQAQLQILDMLSFIKTPEALRDLNKVISPYLYADVYPERSETFCQIFH